jgi:EAL domain-containing protein (putative c-di-GMP-specific phosphodiesterase class I)
MTFLSSATAKPPLAPTLPGLDLGEILPFYQPKASLAGGSAIRSVEVLARLNRRGRMLSPADFIGQAESAGLIGFLTLRIMDRALAERGAAVEAGQSIAFNLSPSLLSDRFVDKALAVIARNGIQPGSIIFEVPEFAIVSIGGERKRALRRLADAGITLSVDDMGAGYSDVERLRDLPVGELKIGRSFIGNLPCFRNVAIVEQTVAMGRQLGVPVVAVGVETEEHWSSVSMLGCDAAQGYFIGRPVPCDAFASVAETWVDPWWDIALRPDRLVH